MLLKLGLRYRSHDRLWFSLFHETGHILLHRKRQFLVEGMNGVPGNLEQAGDVFADEIFIPVPAYRGFVQRAVVASSTIPASAGKQGIAPDIVVSALHHEHRLSLVLSMV